MMIICNINNIQMDYQQLVNSPQDEKDLFKKLVIKPFLIGIAYGAGHFMAYLLLNHKYFKPLSDVAKQ